MKKYKDVLLLLLDLCVVVVGYYLALSMYTNFSSDRFAVFSGSIIQILLVLGIYIIVFFVFDFNRVLWSHISVGEGLRVMTGNVVASFAVMLLITLGLIEVLPHSVAGIAFFIVTLSHEMIRFSYRGYRYLRKKFSKNNDGTRILVYGGGQAGSILIREFTTSDNIKGNIIGILDDNPDIKGRYILDKKVLGSGKDLETVIERYDIEEIIVAMPSVPLPELRAILEKCLKTGIPVKSLGSLEDLINDKPLRHNLNPVDIVDLLGRKEIVLDDTEISKSIVGKRILVTGGAGSIGSELVRQIITYKPLLLVLLDINENGLYAIQQEINIMRRDGRIDNTTELKFYVGTVRDKKSVERIFMNNEFDIVFHAAAHKHVPLMETSPAEAIKNNVFGTHNLIELAKKYKVKKFLNVSTDKAVNPTNVMGATKRFNEMLLQSQDSSDTKFVAVRFGNVLGSNGSVVPLFKEQIAAGGPVMVTHPEIIRYFMTIPEAVSLILEATTFANGGEIFVLDMGEPVKILDLAKRVITLSGYVPNRDIDISYSGLRPGEKLYEELLMSEEGLERTSNNLIHVAKPIAIDKDILMQHFNALRTLVDDLAPMEEIIETLKQAVPTFKHEEVTVLISEEFKESIETL
jgi:FlaA1/EpsC-like NDP-sugar epimerase